jgi:putative FmdB family regulatory protein
VAQNWHSETVSAREEPVPRYQYACTECGHQLEAVQSFTDEPLTECPECAGRLRKVFSSVGVVFKGSGFYRNDSRSGANGAKSETKSESKAETKSETKAESTTKTDSTPKTETKKADSKPATATAA